jgi:putative ABC transport system permease protein
MIPFIYNVRSLRARKTTTLLTAGGVAGVVFVLSAALMLQAGVRETLGRAGSKDHAIVLRKGSASEMASVIPIASAAIIRAAPGVRHGSDGAPLAIGELVLIKYVERVGTTKGANLQIRGVPANVVELRPGVHIIEGRAANPGTNEAIVGRAVRGKFKGLDLGQAFEIRKDRQVQIVGVFDAQGSSIESELWTDLDTARAAFGREGVVSTLRVQLESPAALETFRAAVEQDRQLGVEVLREDRFFEQQSEGTATFLGSMGILIAVFASFGAMIGAASTMYAAVNQRRRETGILRALGFGRRQILACFLLESLLVALAGGVLGALASLGMVFAKFSMMSIASFSQVVFGFHPTPGIAIASVLVGGMMGVAGGFLPAVRAARVSPTEAMRS